MVRLQGSPEETRRLMKSRLLSHKEVSKKKSTESYVKNRNYTETELTHEFSNKIEKSF